MTPLTLSNDLEDDIEELADKLEGHPIGNNMANVLKAYRAFNNGDATLHDLVAEMSEATYNIKTFGEDK